MSYLYTTYEQAVQAFEDAMEDAAGDYPDMHPDSYAHDLVESVALFSSPEAASELRRRQLGC